MKVEISHGELLDKLSVLQIKKEKIKDPERQVNIDKEFNYLLNSIKSETQISLSSDSYNTLLDVNKKILQTIEDIKVKIHSGELDDECFQLFMNSYSLNEEKILIKKEINILFSSSFLEE